jgi:hypothetical protein
MTETELEDKKLYIEFGKKIAKKIQKKYECNILMYNFDPYVLYSIKDIVRILELFGSSISIQYIINYIVSKPTKIFGKIEIHKININGYDDYFVETEGLYEILSISKKQPTIQFIKSTGINMELYFDKIPYNSLVSILHVFYSEIIIENKDFNKYEVFCDKTETNALKYVRDLYFENYNLIVQCSSKYNKYDIVNVDEEIVSKINCKIIRYNPYDKGFDIFNIINRIYDHITKYI